MCVCVCIWECLCLRWEYGVPVCTCVHAMRLAVSVCRYMRIWRCRCVGVRVRTFGGVCVL